MSDLIERLRAVPVLRSDVANAALCREAATALEAAQRENERLRDVLHGIWGRSYDTRAQIRSAAGKAIGLSDDNEQLPSEKQEA